MTDRRESLSDALALLEQATALIAEAVVTVSVVVKNEYENEGDD